MGKKKGNSRSGKRGRSRGTGFENDGGIAPGGLDRISRLEGKILLAMTTASNHFEVGLTPFLDAKLGVLATTYELFRFTWLKFTIHPSDNATSNAQALGFLPDRPTATGFPASLAEVMELAYSKFMAAREIDPLWIAIDRIGLLGRTALKWWDTDTTASEATYQGRIITRTDQAAVILNVIMEYQIEFCNPIPTSVTLQRLWRLQRTGLLPSVDDDGNLVPPARPPFHHFLTLGPRQSVEDGDEFVSLNKPDADDVTAVSQPSGRKIVNPDRESITTAKTRMPLARRGV